MMGKAGSGDSFFRMGLWIVPAELLFAMKHRVALVKYPTNPKVEELPDAQT